MLLKAITLAIFCVTAQGATADTLDQLAGKSAFIRADLYHLKKVNATSVYASTKAYCPSVYWRSSKAISDRDARKGFKNEVEREMKQAGFPNASINHCVENSGFIFKDLQLQNHSKNAKYTRVVHPGIMVFRKKGSGTTQSVPILAEVRTFTDLSWKVYDSSFKEICRQVGSGQKITNRCKPFGTLVGSGTDYSGRTSQTLQNDNYEVMFITRRTPSYAKSTFRKTFK